MDRPVDDVKEKCRKSNREHECRECSKRFSSWSSLKMHAATSHTVQEPFKCSECHETFTRSADLKKHTRTRHHSTAARRRPLTCRKCDKIFTLAAHYENHTRIHTWPSS